MQFVSTPISGMIVVEPRVFEDHRGFFMETYHRERFAAKGIALPFVQDNHSFSRRGVLRGLHYQLRFPQGKLVRCVRGAVWDVGVDLRRGSSTFGQWHGVELTSENRRQLYLPPGLAHGFCVLGDEAEIEYKCTDVYHPEDEQTLVWNDPTVAIAWPIANPVLAPKDLAGKTWTAAAFYET